MARKPAKFKLNAIQQKMAADNLNLARREAWRIQRQTGIEYHTLESVAFEGLCKAAFRYDPERPHPVTGKSMKFSSLAIPTIRGELLHWVRDRTYAMRLSHKMRERWVKGRKLLYRGSTDIEVAAALGIKLEEWQEVRKVCSGPPLELKDQATPTEPLEPSEVNFGAMYLEHAERAMEELRGAHGGHMDQMEVYLSGNGTRIPKAAVDAILQSAGCAATDWSQMDVNLVEGWEDLGDDRFQGSLF
jgi:DNA-directed RNA polymerase sigma subunit (sigma70/sigma32)